MNAETLERMRKLVTMSKDIANKLALAGETVLAVELRLEAGRIGRMIKQLEMKHERSKER